MKFVTYIVLTLMLIAETCFQAAAKGEDSDSLKQYLEMLGRNPDDKETLRAIAFHYLYYGDTQKAQAYGKRLLELAERNNDRYYCELYGHLVTGLSGTETGNHTESYAHLETARTLAKRTQNHEALISIYNGLGIYSLFVNDDAYSAISYYFQALEETTKANDHKRRAIILANISGAYSMRNDLSGLKFAQEAIALARKYNEPIPLYYGLTNAAFYYLDADSIEQAEAAIKEINRLYDENGFDELAELNLLNASLCEKKGDIKGAYYHYATAMENFASASPSAITKIYIQYARLLRNDHHISSAINVLEHNLNHIDNSGVPIHKAELLKELSLTYRKNKQYEKALEYAFSYQDYQEKRFDEIRERATQEARIRHDIYSREQKISEQHIEILSSRNKIAILSGILTVLTVALGMGYYSYKRKNRLYRTIVSRNREYMQREQILLKQLEDRRQPEAPSRASSVLPSDKQQDLISRFTSLMIEQKLFTDPSLTIASVAEALDTNRTYLSKAINELTGKTFTQAVNDYRIRQAIAEISNLEADKPLKQIAQEVGFNSLSTFYTTFQASTGMTPARYRSKLKEI